MLNYVTNVHSHARAHMSGWKTTFRRDLQISDFVNLVWWPALAALHNSPLALLLVPETRRASRRAALCKIRTHTKLPRSLPAYNGRIIKAAWLQNARLEEKPASGVVACLGAIIQSGTWRLDWRPRGDNRFSARPSRFGNVGRRKYSAKNSACSLLRSGGERMSFWDIFALPRFAECLFASTSIEEVYIESRNRKEIINNNNNLY